MTKKSNFEPNSLPSELPSESEIARLALESSEDCIKILDLEGRILFMNAGGLRKLNIPDFGRIAGKCWLDFWAGDGLEKARDLLSKAQEGLPGEFTGALLHSDGTVASYWHVKSNLMRQGAKAARILVTSREVTGQVRSEKEDRQLAEDRFQLFVESVKDYALFMLDTQGTVTTWNEGARRINGYEAAEIIGRHFSQFYTPEDLARNHPAEELKIAAREGRFEEEGWRIRKGGSRFWASVVISRICDRSGKLIGFAKVTRDLTERRKAERAIQEEQKLRDREQLLEQVFSEAPAFMALLGVPDFVYLKSNEQHNKLMGRSDLLGRRLTEVMPGFERQGIVDRLRRVAATGVPYTGKEEPVSFDYGGDRPPGTRYLDFVYQPLRRPDGEVYAIALQGFDVTERVLSRKAVENERENFRNLFKQTPEMVCILRGPDHIFEFVNDAHIKALGFDATGLAVRQAQPDSVEIHDILDHVYRTGRTALLREIPVTVSGRLRHFNLTYAARRNEWGEIDGIMILGVEVTEQVKSSKKLEQAVAERARELKESESFLNSVVENIPNMVFVKDARSLKFVRLNRAGEELLGISRAELIGRSDFDFFPEEEAKMFVTKDRAVLSSGRVLDIPEETIETRKHGRRYLHTRKIPILGQSGNPEYLLGISEDITDWKLAEEERIRAIRQQAALGERKRETERAAYLAEASTILASSLNFGQTLKDLARTTVPAMADWCTVTILHEDGQAERLAAVHQDPAKAPLIDRLARYAKVTDESSGIGHVIKTGKPVFAPSVSDEQLQTAARDPEHLQLMRDLGCTSCIVVPIEFRNKPLGAISLVSERNTRTYNENDLAIAVELGRRAGIAIENASLYESMQRAVKARDEFMSIASHELKTPLTSLKLQAQIRDRDVRKGDFRRFSPENLARLIAEDEKQINRLIRLVEEMLDISRIEAGKFAVSTGPFDLCELIRDASSRYRQQFEMAGVELKVSADCRIIGHWDRFRIEQVFVNLLTNALKYGSGKPVEVSVSEKEGHALLKVKDLGIGIPLKDQKRIFEQFERAVEGRSISGLGLGLYISQQIIEAHQGKISVESKEGEGSVFTVELPIHPDQAPIKNEGEETHPGEEPQITGP